MTETLIGAAKQVDGVSVKLTEELLVSRSSSLMDNDCSFLIPFLILQLFSLHRRKAEAISCDIM